MTKVLVTGAKGFVGRELVDRLQQEEYWVRSTVRHMCDGMPPASEVIALGDISWQTDWSKALTGIEIIIHLAGRAHFSMDPSADPLAEFRRINLGGTESLARQATENGVRKLIYVSTIGVLGDRTRGRPFNEGDIPQPRSDYAISKWEAEQALQRVAQQTALEVVIVRPPLVYGSGNTGKFLQLLKCVERGIPMPLANVDNLRSFLGVGNLVDFLVLCMVNSDAANQTFHVADGEEVNSGVDQANCRVLRAVCAVMSVSGTSVALRRTPGRTGGCGRRFDGIAHDRYEQGKNHLRLDPAGLSE